MPRAQVVEDLSSGDPTVFESRGAPQGQFWQENWTMSLQNRHTGERQKNSNAPVRSHVVEEPGDPS